MGERRQKIRALFHELSPREYMYFPKGSLEMGRPGHFSRIEVFHLVVSMFVLTLSFSILLTRNSLFSGDLFSLMHAMPFSFLGILTAFFVHELSHKFMAQKYGLWSEFRMFPLGLLLAFLLAFFAPFIFAAPGAVMFRGEARDFEMGRIAAAGSMANIAIAMITFPFYILVFFEVDPWGKIFGFVCLVNALLATFNLLPLGSLDGVKIIRWNGIVWSLLFILSLFVTLLILFRAPSFLI